MINMLTSAAFVAALSFAAPAVSAMPLGGIDGSAPPAVTLVSGGCGPFAHRGPYGGCRPGGGGYYYGGPAFRRCPYGYHLGPYGGACHPNY